MTIDLTATPDILVVHGALVRCWTGRTAEGHECKVYVSGIQCDAEKRSDELEALANNFGPGLHPGPGANPDPSMPPHQRAALEMDQLISDWRGVAQKMIDARSSIRPDVVLLAGIAAMHAVYGRAALVGQRREEAEETPPPPFSAN